MFGLVNVCKADPEDPKALVNPSKCSPMCDGVSRNPWVGVILRALQEGEGYKGLPHLKPAGSIISALRSCSVWDVC